MKENNGFPAWNNNPEIFEINRLPARTIFTGFSDPANAFRAGRSVPGSDGKTLSPSVSASDRFLSLNGKWKFHLAERPSERPSAFFQPSFDSSLWKDITVPAHWQLEGWDYPQYTNIRYPWEKNEDLVPPFAPEKYNPVGSYLIRFALPVGWENMQTSISFQGVESAFYIWLNGEFVGYSEDSFTPAEFDLTPFLQNGDNLLAVEVYRWCDASWLEDQDFWRLSGIFRDVFLFARPVVHIYDYQVKASLSDSLRDGVLEIDVVMRCAAATKINSCKYSLELSATASDGSEVLSVTATFFNFPPEKKSDNDSENATSLTLVSRANVPSVLPWSAEIPNLYTILLVLKDGEGRVIESTAFRVGFRNFRIKDGIMELNGKRIVFYGVNRHEFNKNRGRCIGATDMVSDVMEMKRNNINAVRTSHYPNALLWYDLCDYYGLYLIDETNLETHGTWQYGALEQTDTALPGNKPEWTECVLDRARSMFFRDRNHSSILMWSLGNESYGGTNHEKMHDFFTRSDPSRIVHYEGVFHFRKGDRASDIESQMYTPAVGIEAYAKEFAEARSRGEARKPFLLCEYSHAMGNSCGGLHLYTDLFKKYDCLQGGFIWDWIDQAIETKTISGIPYLAYGGDFGEVPNDGNFSGNGLVFADRSVTPKLHEVRACYQQYDFALSDNEKYLVEITDRTLFNGFIGLRAEWKLLADGEVLSAGSLAFSDGNMSSSVGNLWLCTGAQEAISSIRTQENLMNRELVLEVHLAYAADTAWASSGDAVASAQFLLPFFRTRPLQTARTKTGCISRPRLEKKTDGSFTVHSGSSLSLSFSPSGELLSIGNGTSVQKFSSFRPDFYRAPIDNDRGNLFIERHGLWKFAGMSAFLGTVLPEITEEEGKLTIRVAYPLPAILKATCILAWEFFSDGRVCLTGELSCGKGLGLPEIPFIGIEAVFPSPIDSFEWYGLGPHENYIDRRRSALLGKYRSTPSASYVPYLKPQECGNRSGVRCLELTTKAGTKLTFCDSTEAKASFEFSVLPWSREELEKARHSYELPRETKSVLRLGMVQMGVGGDNSWGARTLSEFMPSPEKDYRWSVDITFV